MKNKGKIIFFTKEDGIMYEVLKNMRNKSAMDLLKENGISLTPPINISLLLQRLGIKEVAADFSDIERFCSMIREKFLGLHLHRKSRWEYSIGLVIRLIEDVLQWLMRLRIVVYIQTR